MSLPKKKRMPKCPICGEQLTDYSYDSSGINFNISQKMWVTRSGPFECKPCQESRHKDDDDRPTVYVSIGKTLCYYDGGGWSIIPVENKKWKNPDRVVPIKIHGSGFWNEPIRANL